MQCPHCRTENRDERADCNHCGADLTPLRSVVIRSKHHFNAALEHAARGRNAEAIGECEAALDLNAALVDAWVVLGTLHAKSERFADARAAWTSALALDPRFAKCHEYLIKAGALEPALPEIRRARAMASLAGAGAILLAAALGASLLATTFLKGTAFSEGGGGQGALGFVLFISVPVLAGLAMRYAAAGATVKSGGSPASKGTAGH